MEKSPSANPSPALNKLRAQIDKIDREVIKLINERAKLAHEIGNVKRTTGQAVYDPAREEEVLGRAIEHHKGPLSPLCIRAVFREIISGSRALEKDLRVSFLGPAYTYSHLAALHKFGQGVEMLPVSTIGAVFEEVNRGHAHYGLVPLENSTDGRIADTLENFVRLPVRICGEVQLRIHHNLLGRGSRGEIQEIYSKPQALSQCRNWLSRHLPGARTIEVTSTTTAAQLAQDKPGAAAIASVQAGLHYGLSVLAENIEDNPSNFTRFAVIGEHPATRTGHDKTAIMFEVDHQPGALADAMQIFKRNRLNLTWIESFPIPEFPGRYLFFIELEGHQQDLRARRAVESLEKKALRMVVLGSYAKSSPVE
ncbi:MAG TPA: prephenate dehydratase [Pirellulales bacterium]|jgi:chorismate mutase/prephenate dehydratase|nr:prephenate dehydratase [Pirellulales bacterium]